MSALPIIKADFGRRTSASTATCDHSFPYTDDPNPKCYECELSLHEPERKLLELGYSKFDLYRGGGVPAGVVAQIVGYKKQNAL